MVDEDTTRLINNDQPRLRTFKFIVIVFAITLTRLLFGYDRGALGGASLGWLEKKILTDAQYSELVSLPIFVAIAGGLFGGYLQNKLGRKVSILVSVGFYGLGLTLCIMLITPTYSILMVGRSLCNFGFGMGHVTSLVYLLELTPSYMRGKILVANQMVKPFGNSVSGLVNLAISKSVGSSEWRLMLGSSLIPCALQLLLMIPIPMSYKWLYANDKLELSQREADKLYVDLTRAQYKKLLDINAEKDDDDSSSVTAIQTKRKPKINRSIVRRMVTVALGLIIVGQVSGFSAVMYYSVQIGHTSGIGDGNDSTGVFLVSEGIFVANFVGVLISLLLIERLGRRRLLLISQIGTICSIALIVTALFLVDSMAMSDDPWPSVVNTECLVDTCTSCVAQQACGFCQFNTTLGSTGFCIDGNVSHSILDRCETHGGTYTSTDCHSKSNWFLVLSIIAFVIYFSIGLAPIPFVIAAEIFPQHLRDMFTSISVSTYYSMTAIVSLSFGELYPIIGIKYVFMLFGILSVLGLFFVICLVPETKGKTPATMYELFEEPWCCGGSRGEYHVINSQASDEEDIVNT
ncbi:uncharacterized protein LOC134812930 [Bolinopsis microptera]|uniref:uncharacterized protein LOC134812930 n=1 Tax=Bolinopsis microptera TaxID=2820187 RepID=UPI00307911C5